MPLTFAIPDTVLSTTLANYVPTMTDNIFRANPLFMWLVGKYPNQPYDQNVTRGQLKILDGGESIVQPLLYDKNNTAKSYAGYGIIDTTPQDGMTAARFVWKQIATSISISGRDERQNAGGSRVIGLLDAKIKQAEMSLQEEIDREAHGSGTDSTTDLLGLQTICATTGTVGGIARSGNAWWQAKVNTSGGSFAAGGLDAMRTQYNNQSKGNDHPDLILSDQTTYERYEKLLQPQERFTDNQLADGGFQNLKFKGAVYMFDLYNVAGYQYFINSKYLNFQVHKDANFATTDFVKPENQDARVAQILIMGELTASNCIRQGVIQGFTA